MTERSPERSRHRRTSPSPAHRRSWLVAAALAAVLVIGAFLLHRAGVGPGTAAPTTSDTASRTAGPSPSPSVSLSPTHPSPSASPSETTATAAPGPTAYALGTFPVASTQLTFVDPSRPTMARGSRPTTSERTLLTTVWHPSGGGATGSFPVVVFAEGFNIAADRYAPLLEDLASRGYVVVAPEFPLATTIYGGPASQADLDNEPGDVSFVLTKVLEASAAAGPLQGLLDPARVAVMGHSDGAAVAAVLGYDPTFRDRRFTSAVILSGQSGDIRGPSGLDASPPLLVAHGTADEINPYGIGEELYAAVSPPHALLTIAGGRHLEPFTTDPIRPAVSEVIAAFLDLHLKGVGSSRETLGRVGNAPGLSLQSS